MFGFSKSFTIFFIISVLISIATKNWENGLTIMIIYGIIRIIWKLFTD
jgi:hypothetical protein